MPRFLWGFSIHAEFLLGGSSLLPTYSERQDSRRTGHVERLGRNSTLRGKPVALELNSYSQIWDVRSWTRRIFLSDNLWRVFWCFLFTLASDKGLFWKTGGSHQLPQKRSKRSHVMWIHVGSLQRVSCSNEKGPSWEDQRVSPPWRISMQQVLPDMGQVVRIFAFPKPLKTGGWADWAKKWRFTYPICRCYA